MANERQQQSKKSYRQKGRVSKPAVNAGNTSLANPLCANDFVVLPLFPQTSLNPAKACPDNSGEEPVECVSKTVETMESLLSSVCSDDAETNVAPNMAPSQDSGNAWSLAVDFKLNELMERSKSFERERVEIEALREHLKQAIETAEFRLVSSGSDQNTVRLQELESRLIASQQENTKASTLLLHTRAEYQSLLAFIEAEAIDAENSDAKLTSIAQRVLEKTDARELELSLEVSQLNDQLHFLKSELDEARSAPSNRNSDESELRLQIEQLRSQLLEARHETIDLRIQSNDMGSKLAKFGPVVSRSETLTWEQRKEALLQQLEAETRAETPCDPSKALEIENILLQTTREIERRDDEIAELKTIIDQQSFARDGMSIGVSAIAEMIESDGLIVAERLRLKELRDDWEQKQRQAEIEMSMERAKLARERLEIQEKTQEYAHNNPPQTEEEKQSGKTRTRGRWLARLGLRDE